MPRLGAEYGCFPQLKQFFRFFSCFVLISVSPSNLFNYIWLSLGPLFVRVFFCALFWVSFGVCLFIYLFIAFCLFLWSHWLIVIITSCFCNLFPPKDKTNTSLSQSRVAFFAQQVGDGTPRQTCTHMHRVHPESVCNLSPA